MEWTGVATVAGAVGTTITTIIALSSMIKARRADTRVDALRRKAVNLSSFIDTHPQLAGFLNNHDTLRGAIASAKQELEDVLHELSRYPSASNSQLRVDSIAFPRRWFLLFAPRRRGAWILHFAFYSVTVSIPLIFFSLDDMPELSSFVHEWGLILVAFSVLFIVFIRSWAMMEQRWAEGFTSSPSHECQAWLWYLPVNRRDLFARWIMIDQLLIALLQAYSGDDPLFGFWPHPWTSYFMFLAELLAGFVAYSWARSELRLLGEDRISRFPTCLRFIYRPADIASYAWVSCFWFFVVYAIYVSLSHWHDNGVTISNGINVVPDVEEFGSGFAGGVVSGGIVTAIELSTLLYGINRILTYRYYRNESPQSLAVSSE
jgi:hypothetical protein